MNEDFLHYIWKTQQIKPNQLSLNNKESLIVTKPGIHNFNAGPDFLEADIQLGKTRWLGAVEIHLKASDWLKHQHQHDVAYNQVILHVVWMNDQAIFRQAGSEIPCLELKGKVPAYLIENYQKLKAEMAEIPCHRTLGQIDSIFKFQVLEKMLLERLQEKTNDILKSVENSQGHWEMTFYKRLFRAFGFNINALAFAKLFDSIPFSILFKLKTEPTQMQALLFGQAGFLEEKPGDDYQQQLKKEYRHLQRKYKLKPISLSYWKTSRLRPANFPCLRIAQLGTLLTKAESQYQKLINSDNLQWLEYLGGIRPVDYWQNHLNFGRVCRKRNPALGKGAINLLKINLVLPFLFLYRKVWEMGPDLDLIVEEYQKIPAEDNKIIRTWNKLNWKAISAFDSQALIQLKRNYCDSKKCLICSIGNEVLKTTHHDKKNT